MIDLLAVYICPNCGEILEDMKTRVTEIYSTVDEVITFDICNKCNEEVSPKLIDVADGKKIPCLEKVDHERWLWHAGYFSQDADRERLEDYL